MFTVDASRIRTLLFERGISIAELAKLAKLNGLTARKVIADGSAVTTKTISALAKFFGVDGETLILKKGD